MNHIKKLVKIITKDYNYSSILDDERIKGNGGGNYWKELLARIKDIRLSEKVLYRQILTKDKFVCYTRNIF